MQSQDDNGTRLDFHTESEHQTDLLGAALSAVLEPGVVVALVGNLGAGKTRLVRAIAAALGVEENEVTSPTFVLIQEYAGKLPLYHFDTYRLRDTDEFLELGADELMYGDGVCLIEWADRVVELLPKDRLTIEIVATGQTTRQFSISSSGPKSNGIVTKLRNTIAPEA